MTDEQRQAGKQLINRYARYTNISTKAVCEWIYNEFLLVYALEPQVDVEQILEVEDPQDLLPWLLADLAKELDPFGLLPRQFDAISNQQPIQQLAHRHRNSN